MNRMYGYCLSALLLAGVGAAALQCGPGALCGNGVKEEGEQCDIGSQNGAVNASCSAECNTLSVPRAMLQIFYSRLKAGVSTYPNFPTPSCQSLGISEARAAHVVLDGPSPKDEVWPCNMISRAYDFIDPGTYQATITLLDDAGAPVTKPVKSTPVDVKIGGAAPNLMVNFTTTDYLRQDYRGNFDFVPHWGKRDKTCEAAEVTSQAVKLTLPGSVTPVAGMTNKGHRLDGSPGPCFVKSGAMGYLEVPMLPWGRYDLYLKGISGNHGHDRAMFCQKFEVFVGVGVATPTYDLVVDPASEDGGACPD